MKTIKELDKTALLLLEQYGLKEELYSKMKPILYITNGFVHYGDGEVVTEEEFDFRLNRTLEILDLVLTKAKTTTLIEGKITLTEEK